MYNISPKWGTASCLAMLFPCKFIPWFVLVQIINWWATTTKLQRYSIFPCKGVHIQRDKRLHSSLPFPCKAVCCTIVTGLTIVHEGLNQVKALRNWMLCIYLKRCPWILKQTERQPEGKGKEDKDGGKKIRQLYCEIQDEQKHNLVILKPMNHRYC